MNNLRNAKIAETPNSTHATTNWYILTLLARFLLVSLLIISCCHLSFWTILCGGFRKPWAAIALIALFVSVIGKRRTTTSAIYVLLPRLLTLVCAYVEPQLCALHCMAAGAAEAQDKTEFSWSAHLFFTFYLTIPALLMDFYALKNSPFWLAASMGFSLLAMVQDCMAGGEKWSERSILASVRFLIFVFGYFHCGQLFLTEASATQDLALPDSQSNSKLVIEMKQFIRRTQLLTEVEKINSYHRVITVNNSTGRKRSVTDSKVKYLTGDTTPPFYWGRFLRTLSPHNNIPTAQELQRALSWEAKHHQNEPFHETSDNLINSLLHQDDGNDHSAAKTNLTFEHEDHQPTWDADFYEKITTDWTYDTTQDSFTKAGYHLLFPHCNNLGCATPHIILNFLRAVEDSYMEQPYHNAHHAAMTASKMFVILNLMGLLSKINDLEKLSIAVAGLCHDMGHPGINNSYLVKSRHELATVYHDASVLENYHAYLFFKALEIPGCNIFSKLPTELTSNIRTNIIKMILATDLNLHPIIIREFSATTLGGFDMENANSRSLLYQMVIKASDIGHTALSWQTHYHWSVRAITEMQNQGDKEKAIGIPTSMLCDRNLNWKWPAAQADFIKTIAVSTFEALNSLCPEGDLSRICLPQLNVNLSIWGEMTMHSPPKLPETFKWQDQDTLLKVKEFIEYTKKD